MNKTTIEWCDQTHNPGTGCSKGCGWCYAQKIAHRFTGARGGKMYPYGFEPTVYPERFEQPPPVKPCRVFLMSMGDVCNPGAWKVPGGLSITAEHFQRMVWEYCAKYPLHQFIVLTKRPCNLYNYNEHDLPNNVVFGVSYEHPSVEAIDRIVLLESMYGYGLVKNVVVSHEPAMGELRRLFPVTPGTGWLIIGDLTGAEGGKLKPHQIDAEIGMARELGWKVFVKDTIIKRVPFLCEFGPDFLESSIVDANWPREFLPMPKK